MVSPAAIVKPLLLVSVALALVAGVAGGLLRAGIALPAGAAATWPGQAAVAHAALMICGFLGTVIGIERAVAVRHRAAFVGPVLSAAAGLGLLAGQSTAGAALNLAAALWFVAVNIVIVRRQRAPHTVLLLAAAACWAVGSALYAAQGGDTATLAWWFTFLVLTIAAERLEMMRLMRRRPGAQQAFYAIAAALPAGAALTSLAPQAGGVLYGAALALLAGWLMRCDIARRTLFATGLSRYMAVCLLAGYTWLMVAGAAWAALALGWPLRDVALHALGLGFIVSMMMGHAPVILPAIARVKLQFGRVFYLPLAALHGSLVLRLGFGAFDPQLRATGAALNAAAMALFALTVLGAIVAWRVTHAPQAGPRALRHR